NGKKVIVDPFITGNDLSDLDAETLEVDYIILTHGHGDHFGDTVELANRNHATDIGSAELGDYLTTTKNVENVRPMNISGKAEFDFVKVKFEHEFHSSILTVDNGI